MTMVAKDYGSCNTVTVEKQNSLTSRINVYCVSLSLDKSWYEIITFK